MPGGLLALSRERGMRSWKCALDDLNSHVVIRSSSQVMASPVLTHRDSFASPVWLLKGLTGNISAQLLYEQGSLVLLTEGAPRFEAPLANVRAIFPWYYFGGGVKLTVYGVRYRISFVRPTGAASVERSMLAYIPVVREMRDIRAGVRLGKVWKEILAPANGAQ